MESKFMGWASGIEVHWLKFISSLLLIASAIYVPAVAAASAEYVGPISAAFSAAGGALLSDSLSTPGRFIKTISPRLNSVNRLLATITSQISSILMEEKEKSTDNHAINRLCEVVPALRAVITDVSELTGEKFDPNTLNETIDSIGDLITQIEAGKVTPDAPEITEQLKSMIEKLRTKDSSRMITKVSCPYDECKETMQIELGASPPSSRVVSCEKCEQRYHAHRKGDGGVFTKQWGSAVAKAA